MNGLNKQDLDRYITGNYGEDQFKGEEEMERIDQKYHIEASKIDTGVPHNSNDSILFLAKDKLVPGMLGDYIVRAKKAKCNKNFIKVITEVRERVIEWQKENESLVKIPD